MTGFPVYLDMLIRKTGVVSKGQSGPRITRLKRSEVIQNNRYIPVVSSVGPSKRSSDENHTAKLLNLCSSIKWPRGETPCANRAVKNKEQDGRANETSSRRVGVWKGTAIRVRVQFGKGYKRKIYDNALCVEGELPPAGGRREEDGGSRSHRGLGVVLTLPP